MISFAFPTPIALLDDFRLRERERYRESESEITKQERERKELREIGSLLYCCLVLSVSATTTPYVMFAGVPMDLSVFRSSWEW